MDHDMLVEEWKRIYQHLSKLVPSNEEYGATMKQFKELSELIMKHDKSCSDELEREHKIEVEDRMREIEADIERAKERNQGRLSKQQAVWRLIEIAFQGLVMLVGITFTGKLEESKILSSKAWSLIIKPPKV